MMLLLACAATPPDFAPAALCADPYGFWSGLLHGWIFTLAWVVSLFDSSVAVYAPCNTGGWYDFGFLLGLGATGGGASRAAGAAGARAGRGRR